MDSKQGEAKVLLSASSDPCTCCKPTEKAKQRTVLQLHPEQDDQTQHKSSTGERVLGRGVVPFVTQPTAVVNNLTDFTEVALRAN